jgi:hypothetical protein
MPVIHYPGYVTKEEAAIQHGVKSRTITDWINRGLAASKGISYIKVDGYVFVKDKNNPTAPPPGFSLASLEHVRKFADRKNLYSERIYAEILLGTISGVIIWKHVFVIKNEPALLDFLKSYKRRR